MSWGFSQNWTDHYDDGDMAADALGLPLAANDTLARQLAKAAGEDWDRLNVHPGFRRQHWRDMARKLAA